MKRRDFLSGLAASAALSGPALAQDYVGSVISQLKKMGFRITKEERTLLGRIRIVATRRDGRREIIINPNNGEILRDLWTPDQKSKPTSIIEDKSGSGGGRDDDDDDSDDNDDDEGGGDNSGSGGGDDGGGDDGGGDDGGGDDGGDDGGGDDGDDDDGGDDGGDDDSDDDDD